MIGSGSASVENFEACNTVPSVCQRSSSNENGNQYVPKVADACSIECLL